MRYWTRSLLQLITISSIIQMGKIGKNGENKDHSSNLNLGGTHWVKLGPCFGLSGTRWMAVNWATCQTFSLGNNDRFYPILGLQQEAMRFPADFSFLLVIQPGKGEKNHLKPPLIDEMILLNQHFDWKDNWISHLKGPTFVIQGSASSIISTAISWRGMFTSDTFWNRLASSVRWGWVKTLYPWWTSK